MNDNKEKSLFEKFYDITKEALKELQKPLVKRALRRSAESGIDSLTEQITKIEVDFDKMLEKIEDLDFNKASELRLKRKKLIEQKEDMKSFYKELFGKDYNEDAD